MARPTRAMLATAAAVVVAAAVGGGAVYGLTSHNSSAAPATSAPAPAPTGAARGKRPAGGGALAGLLTRVQHGEFTTASATGAAATMAVQRGTITAVDANSVTVRSTDGYTASYAITPSTAVDRPKGKHAAGQPQAEAPAGQPAPAEQPGPAGQSAPAASSTAGLRPNESVMVLATKGATGDTATRIVPVKNAV